MMSTPSPNLKNNGKITFKQFVWKGGNRYE